ncbi:MrcB family domain-containing protein [Herbaspirillum sp. NPDC101397]|uniref:MrcB family domain-containing protein n=1 Tax=Herbaspirillum sp. NPDC101397 TaxID=3364006 RepID=UPI00383A0151
MIELKTVFAEYLPAKEKYGRVPRNVEIPALVEAIRKSIPGFFLECVERGGYISTEWLTKGSIGEPNRTFAHVPWVAIFKRSITKSALEGYYIVLLFSEDMSSVYLTLNQAFTAFETRYGSINLAYRKLQDCAQQAVLELGPAPDGFTTGPIDLRTKGTLSTGYEFGSIWAKEYFVDELPSQTELESDVLILMQAYKTLWTKFPHSLVDANTEISNDEFVKAVEITVKTVPKAPATQGPQPPPPKLKSSGREVFSRSANVSARAISMSDGVCALSGGPGTHASFLWKKTGMTYVEAHHLIPFSKQDQFPHSLDVEENIVALCANCHRLLHHARSDEKNEPLRRLWQLRKDDLAARGLVVELNELKKMYGKLAEED